MKVSVVIPAYNEEKLLGKCLESLEKQTIKPLEIIVVDNNSTDNTSKIATDFGAKVVKEERQGTSYARNTGYNLAKGDIIARTDADTIVPPNWIEKIIEGFQNENVGIVCGGVVYFSKYLNYLSHLYVFWADDIFGYKAITGPNYSIRKKVWEKIEKEVHNNNEKFHEDLDVAIHAQRVGEYIRFYDLMVRSSARKFSNLNDFFIKYPKKSLNTLFIREHRKLSFNPIIRWV